MMAASPGALAPNTAKQALVTQTPCECIAESVVPLTVSNSELAFSLNLPL